MTDLKAREAEPLPTDIAAGPMPTTEVTDAGVRVLAVLPNLRELSIEGCRNVTRAGVSGFTAGVRVSYSSI